MYSHLNDQPLFPSGTNGDITKNCVQHNFHMEQLFDEASV